MFYLVLSLGANLFFFGCIFIQHWHIEGLHKNTRALKRQITFWKLRFKVESMQ